MKQIIWIALSLSLAACGGGGGGTGGGSGGGGGGGGGTPDSFLDPNATQTFSLTSLSSQGGSAGLRDDDSATGQSITIAGLPGQFNAARDRIDFDGDAGTADILSVATEQVAIFNAKPDGSEPFLGVIGVVTPTGDLPDRDGVTYQSDAAARFVIIDGDARKTFIMTSDVLVTANFSGNTLDMVFDDFVGDSLLAGEDDLVPVSNIGTLEIDDADLIAGVFSGGTPDFTRSQGSAISTDLALDGVTTVTSGTFFGEGAAEVAGVVIIEDGTNNLSFQGGFVAN